MQHAKILCRKECTSILIKFVTLGCKTNLYESEALKQLFRNAGHMITDDEFADVYVINTCTVTGNGAQRSRQSIRRCKNTNKNSIVVVTGCYAQTEPNETAQIEGVDIVSGTKDRPKIVELVEQRALHKNQNNSKSERTPVIHITDIMKETEFEDLGATTEQNRVRANLKIQDGCDSFCSYCIIPYARGRVRSRKEDSIINEAKRLADNGFCEIVLTGIHIASYGKDLDDISLIDIVEQICAIDNIRRVRLGSLEPLSVNKNFIMRASKLDKLCKQFHISLQSGCDATLKRMNRRYNTEQYLYAVEQIRKNMPDASITTDVMVGFPSETDEEFTQSYNFCRKVGFMQMHIFKYSKRKNTPAAVMEGQITNKIKNERSAKMMDLARSMKENFYKQYIGKITEVLFEQQAADGQYHGLTANYMDVLAYSKDDLCKKFANIKIASINGEFLTGEPV